MAMRAEAVSGASKRCALFGFGSTDLGFVARGTSGVATGWVSRGLFLTWETV